MVPVLISAFVAITAAQPASQPHLAQLERGYWLHASLGEQTGRNYWRANLPGDIPPTEQEIRAAAGLLTGEYAANCLYLMYHQEISVEQFEQAIQLWRGACPKDVEILPTLCLLMYDKANTPVFAPNELRRVLKFCKERINPGHIGWYDVMPDRPQERDLAIMAEYFPKAIIRVGIQPEEKIDPRCSRVVEDTLERLLRGQNQRGLGQPGPRPRSTGQVDCLPTREHGPRQFRPHRRCMGLPTHPAWRVPRL